MALYNGYGKIVSMGVTPRDCSFFDSEYPSYTNRFDGELTVGALNADGSINTASTGFKTTTNFIRVEPGKYVYSEVTKGAELYFRYYAFYGEDKASVVAYKSGLVTTPVLVPEGAYYIRISYAFSYASNPIFVGIADDNTADLIPYEEYYPDGAYIYAKIRADNIPHDPNKPYTGKKWVLFGDSLTDAYGGDNWDSPFFAGKIGKELGLEIDNRAVSGSNLNDTGNASSGVLVLDALVAEVEAGTTEAPDYITIAFGTNGFSHLIGTATDTSATKTTTYGAMKYFIETIRTKFPDAVFGFVLPPKGSWKEEDGQEFPNTAKDIDATREAMLAVLQMDGYQVPYINMLTESGITLDMLPDKIHIYDGQAQKLYYHAMRRFMMGL